MTHYSQGIAGDGPCILMDGVPLTPEQIVNSLNNKTHAVERLTELMEQYAPGIFDDDDESVRIEDKVYKHSSPPPDGMQLPYDDSITTEMKIACLGEFSWTEEWPYYDEDGVLHEDHVETHAVPWSLCKEIYRAMLKAARGES